MVQNKCTAIDQDQTKCQETPGCGWCIAEGYNSGCVAGDNTGAFLPINPNTQPGGMDPKDCKRSFWVGVALIPGQFCVDHVSSTDTRCYERTQYHTDCPGEGTFIVPSHEACMQYDTAFKQNPAPAMIQQQVQEHVSSYVLKQAVQRMHMKLLVQAGYFELARLTNTTGELQFPTDGVWQMRMGDATRDMIADGLQDLESDGLEKLETGACSVFTGGAGAPFCSMLFNNPIASWINNKIVNCPIVHKFTYWLANTCSDLIPGGARNLMNDVVDTYNDVKKAVKPIEDLWDDCKSAGSSIAKTLFGWL